jgi:hypothetical protein
MAGDGELHINRTRAEMAARYDMVIQGHWTRTTRRIANCDRHSYRDRVTKAIAIDVCASR